MIDYPREKTCAFTGHRSLSDNVVRALSPLLREKIIELSSQGIRRFIAGGAIGFDMLAAITVYNLKPKLPHDTRLTLALPCERHYAKWNKEDAQTFARTLRHDEDDPLYNPDFRQLVHVSFKVAAELGDPATISDAGFVCPRTFVGKGGYFWSDDKLATAPSDDYALIPRRRVIDKAYRIAYQTLVNEISEEVPVTDEGKISAPVVKSIQTAVESAIINNMTSYGNLGNDPGDANDMGVECYINPDQNIVATSRLEVSVRVKPHGYTKYIDVTLGFKVNK